jgi:AraC family carnitine catabolism transcriptional activator
MAQIVMSGRDMDHLTCRVGLVLVPGFSHLGLALVTEPMFIANWLAGRPLFAWTTLSADGLAVPSSSGFCLSVDSPLTSETPFDFALVVASFDPRAAATDARITQWLKRAARAGVRTGGIETGCEIVAAAGLLDGTEVPIHWYNIEGAQERMPTLHASRRRYSMESLRPLSAGGIATLDMMLDFIAHRGGRDLARDIAQHLLLQGPRSELQFDWTTSTGAGHTPAPGLRDPVLVVRDLMEQTLDDPVPLADLARRAGCSLRNLQRLVRRRMGLSLRQLREDVRMAAAHQRVQQTDLSLTEIALACGFASLAVFSRSYRHRFGVPPSRDRHQSVRNTVFRPSSAQQA